MTTVTETKKEIQKKILKDRLVSAPFSFATNPTKKSKEMEAELEALEGVITKEGEFAIKSGYSNMLFQRQQQLKAIQDPYTYLGEIRVVEDKIQQAFESIAKEISKFRVKAGLDTSVDAYKAACIEIGPEAKKIVQKFHSLYYDNTNKSEMIKSLISKNPMELMATTVKGAIDLPSPEKLVESEVTSITKVPPK